MDYLVLKNITKRYKNTGILANDNISLFISKGEIHAIFGDNGAGKSTLAKILYGVIKKDSGEIFLKGKKIKINNEKDAQANGIFFVPQEDLLLEEFTVWENIALWGEGSKLGFLNRKALKKRVVSLMEKYDIFLPPDNVASSLGAGQKRLLSILRALYRDPDILILDEPTSSLPQPQVEEFLKILLSLKERGITIIFISHRWKEITKVADRITILDKGKVLNTFSQNEFFLERFSKEGKRKKGKRLSLKTEDVVFGLSHISYKKRDHILLNDINLQLKKGEIVSILSIAGNGERELEEIVSGMLRPTGGKVFLKGKTFDFLTPSILRENNAGIIPTNTEDGLTSYGTLWENLIITEYKKQPFSVNSVLNFKHIKDYTKERLAKFSLPYTPFVRASSLSGGRKRRLILSRELKKERDLIIAGNPTASLDTFFTEKVLMMLRDFADNGGGVLFFSHNIEDTLSISDRIAILYKGEIVKILKNEGVDHFLIVNYLMGEKVA